MPCCGGTLDYFDYLEQFHHQVFTVEDVSHIRTRCCVLCGHRRVRDGDGDMVNLKHVFIAGGVEYRGFPAYLIEVEPVEGDNRE